MDLKGYKEDFGYHKQGSIVVFKAKGSHYLVE